MMHDVSQGVRRSFAAGLCAGALMLTLSIQSAALAQPASTAAIATVDRWAENVWTTAVRGDADRALALLADVPLGDDARAVALRTALSLRSEHLAKAEQTREERLVAARNELVERSEKGDLAESLRAAV